MTIRKTILGTAAALAMATPAFADGSAHSDGFVHHLVHLMSSPTHGFGAIVAVSAVIAAVVIIRRRKA